MRDAADTRGSALAAAMVSPEASDQSIRSRDNGGDSLVGHLLMENRETDRRHAADDRP